MKNKNELIYVNGSYIELPIERPISYRGGSLRFGYTVEKDGIHNKFIPKKEPIYRCYHAKTDDDGLTNCKFTGSFDVVKTHMENCRGEEE
jgi:hypothetical protein